MITKHSICQNRNLDCAILRLLTEIDLAVLDDGQNTEDEFARLDRSRSINDPDNDDPSEPMLNVITWKIPQKKCKFFPFHSVHQICF